MADGGGAVVRRGPRAPVPGPGGQQQGQQAQAGGGLQGALGTILRFAFMWYMMRSFGQKQQGQHPAGGGANGTAVAPGFAAPVYRRGDLLDMRAYLSESPFLPDDRSGARLVWVERDIPLAAGDEERRRVLRYVPSPAVARNESGLYLHVSFRRAASAVAGGDGGAEMDDGASFGKVYNLIAHLPRPKNKTGVNLLGGDLAAGAALGGSSTGGGFMPPKKNKTAEKEPAPSSSSSILGAKPREIIPFLRPGVGIAMVDHFQAYPRGAIPAPLVPHALLTSDGAGLLPWVWFDDFWQLRDGMYPLNASWVGGRVTSKGDVLPELPGNATEAAEHKQARFVVLQYSPAPPAAAADKDASASSASSYAVAFDEDDDSQASWERRLGMVDRITFGRLKARVLSGDVPAATLVLTLKPLSFWRMQIYTQMEQSFKMQVGTGLAQEGESDEIKRIFLEGNPLLLAVTMVVSLLHSVFDFLAFKNDIGFWRDNKSLEGLSARSVLLNAFSQLVIFLYLLDNDTSMVVLFSAGAGTAIEFWKITKAFDVEVRPLGSFPPIRIRDRASYVESDTRKHDEVAMRYLSYVLMPLVAGYSIYALVYESHRSWYSWALGSLVGAVYAFGFILMCPQLYLNYKLKSVAHLPWRQMTYKFLNTIIDDLFAFVIKMPLLHRLSVFRDDVVFLIYLYQRWIYRVDPKRANEFGFSAEDLLEREKAKKEEEEAKRKQLLQAGQQDAGGRVVEGGEASGSAAAAGAAGGGALRQRRKAEEDKEEVVVEEEGEDEAADEKKDR